MAAAACRTSAAAASGLAATSLGCFVGEEVEAAMENDVNF